MTQEGALEKLGDARPGLWSPTLSDTEAPPEFPASSEGVGNPYPLIWEVPLQVSQQALRLQGKLVVLDIPSWCSRS